MTDSQVESVTSGGFCQGQLWNSNITWYTDTPDFPSCFHKTVLVYIPCCILWLLAGFEIRANMKSPKRFIRRSWVNMSKLTFDICLIVIHILKLSYATWLAQNNAKVLAVDFVALHGIQLRRIIYAKLVHQFFLTIFDIKFGLT